MSNTKVQIGALSVVRDTFRWTDECEVLYVFDRHVFTFESLCRKLAKDGWKPTILDPNGNYIFVREVYNDRGVIKA